MTIAEISIGPEAKKYSQKVMAASEEYLREFDLTNENLSKDQQKIVFDFIKLRRIGWVFALFMSLTAVVGVVVGVFYFNMSSDIIRDLLSTSVQIAFLLGVLGGSAFYCACGSLFQIVFHFGTIRRKRKVLEAFLPSVRSTVVSSIGCKSYS